MLLEHSVIQCAMLNRTTKIIQDYLGEIAVLNIYYKSCQMPNIDYLVDDTLPFGANSQPT